MKAVLFSIVLVFVTTVSDGFAKTYTESFETTPLAASWTLTNQGGGSASVSTEKAHAGSRALKLAIGTYSGGHGGSKTGARLDFGAPLATGAVEAYVYNNSASPYYIFPTLVDEDDKLLLGAWYPDHTNQISAYVPTGETMDQYANVQKQTGWMHLKWVITDGYCDFIINGQLCAKGKLRSAPSALVIAFDTYNKSNYSIWVDSVKVVRTEPIDTDGDEVNDFREGKDGTNPNDATSFNPLSKGLIAYYSFNGIATDESGYGRDGQNFGAAPTQDRSGGPSNAFTFDGSSRVDLPFAQGSITKYTVTSWLKTTKGGVVLGADHQEPALLMGIGKESGGWGENTGRSYLALSATANVWIGKLSSSKTQSTDERWHHVVGVYSSSAGDVVEPKLFRLFVDGVEVASMENTSGNFGGFRKSPLNATSNFSIGTHRRAPGAPSFVGDLDDIRFYNRALTPSEVGQLYHSEADDLDSDGDGLTDAWERGFGRYQIVEGNFTWQQAKADAESRGGHLGTFTTAEEWNFFMQLPQLQPYRSSTSTLARQIWTGGFEVLQGTWKLRWVTGEAWSFYNFAPPEPSAPETSAIAIHPFPTHPVWGTSDNVYWNDDYDYRPQPYILEFGYPTDPFTADTDGDGFNDKVETDSRTDPNNPASKPGSPSLRIEEPVGKGLANSARAKTFGNLLAETASTGRVYTIRNAGAGPLNSIALTKVGSHPNDFTITGPGTNSLAPGESTTFSVSFTPTTGGRRTAQISVASNDTNSSPFLVNLAGFGIGFNVDSDKDGLSDAAEFLLKMYASNFDWQAKQPELVGMLFSNVNPAGFFTKAQYDANFVSGRTTGRSDVTSHPTSYNLVSRTNIPPVRVAMPKSAAFAVNLGGSWTRYAQSGAPAGWSFDTNTGVLNGLAPARGERSVRIVPYNGSQAGPQMTIQFRPTP